MQTFFPPFDQNTLFPLTKHGCFRWLPQDDPGSVGSFFLLKGSFTSVPSLTSCLSRMVIVALLLWGNILHFKAPWVDHRCELNYIIITETENNYSFMAIFFFLFSLLFSIKPDVFIRSVPTGNAVVKVRVHYSEYLFLFHKLILSFLICLFRQQKTSQPVTFSVNRHFPVRVTF